MKTKAELEKDIIHITMKIHQEFPELSKYIAEMPLKTFGSKASGLSINSFRDYYNSLSEVVSEYAKTHVSQLVKPNSDDNKFPGYPLYPPSDDIYSKGLKETDLDPEDLFKSQNPK